VAARPDQNQKEKDVNQAQAGKRPQGAPPAAPLAPSRGTQHVPEHKAVGPEPQHDPVHDHVQRIRRRRGGAGQDNPFELPLDQIPEGSSYEWKRWSNVGAQDPFYIASMRDQGWEPVDPKRHPNWVPPGYNDPYILKGGMILMERPMELTEDAKREARQAAQAQISFQEQRLGITPKDTLSRDLVKPKIVKEIGRMVVED
jgi:hypothetical protein